MSEQASTDQSPLLLFSNGEADAEFLYAAKIAPEYGLYLRFAEADDVLVVGRLEQDRARAASQAKRVLSQAEAGWEEKGDEYASWADVAARLLRERGLSRARTSAETRLGYFQELEKADVGVDVDKDLFVAERRRKDQQEANAIHAAQRAAEAATVEVIGILGTADIRSGELWVDGRPLTSERLLAQAQAALAEIGYRPNEMIIAGSPNSAMPHFRGEGPIRAHAPVVIDIFPQGITSHYCGDLTRTVVVGEAPEEAQKMHAACVAALEEAIKLIRPGVNGRDVHRRACEVLVEHGYSTYTPGYEGREGTAQLIHSLGHGVGLEVHEAPSLADRDYVLEEGDVVTVEPGLYLPGFGGVRVEDTGMVTRDGFRNFSSISRSLDPKAYL